MNDALSMLLATALVTLASSALARQVWREAEGGLLPAVGEMRGEALLAGLTGPRIAPSR